MLKASVIVPVYNPGQNIDDCIRSLLGQSLAPDEYEVIFVDDGSTDDTPARLDALAAEHANVHVVHTPNSGWPGRPRNIGVDLARGEYVLFVDNDDWLGREALERLHAAAVRDDADIVIGKVVGHGKGVPRGIFRRSRSGATLGWGPLLTLLTPHKLFRRSMLVEHAIRFPEGRRRLEDHLFVVHAYFHARRISVVADYPAYFWVLREDEGNASTGGFDPAGYYGNLREVLDLVREHTEPGPFRDRLEAHWYRGKTLGRVGTGTFLRRDPDYRRQLFEEIRGLALERYGPRADATLALNLRVRSRLLRDGDYEGLQALAAAESGLRAQVAVRDQNHDGGRLVLQLEGGLAGEDGSLAFTRRDGRLLWVPPAPLAPGLRDEDLDATDEVTRGRVEVIARSVADRSEYLLPGRSEVRLVPVGQGDERLTPVVLADVRLTPGTAAAGSALPPGRWQLLAVVAVAGFSATARLREPPRAGGRRLVVTVG
ncbi:MAG: glycosyltransferase, partial [Actinomycetota bacterium]|nr:glycosyltransferase [Actinomycetota bacterium]